MKLLICLGNPGIKYENTRHNVGFMFADLLAEKLGCNFSNETKFKCEMAKGVYNDESIWIIKPQTFMNLSGESLALLKNFYKIDISTLVLVYDDISLDIGKIRFRSKGSDGGHNGVKSIIKHAQTQVFDRIKIGIGPQPPYMKSEDYVLQNFSQDEKTVLKETLSRTLEAFLYYCDVNADLNKVQNKYN
ncbi:TPA: aminoacyl-tRNA hydrolase [Candidatus Avigastranaerophilus faecigallinarum]|nr:aminoacyl-tRNA hydrolase [Candidatus Avigastranaerophilus faecigallinarum]